MNDILNHFKACKGESLYVQAKFIIDTINCFMNSDDDFPPTSKHVPKFKLNDKTGKKEPVPLHLQNVSLYKSVNGKDNRM